MELPVITFLLLNKQRGEIWIPGPDRSSPWEYRWMPAENRILWAPDINDDNTLYVYRVNPSTALGSILNVNDFDGHWQASNDGKKLAFVSYDGNKYGVCVMDLDGNNRRELVTFARWTWGPIWTPDDKRILFHVPQQEGPESDTYIVDVDGNNLELLVASAGIVGWKP